MLTTAWPFIRADLGLDYAQIGLLVGIPMAIGNVVEPVLGIAGDVGNRRAIVRAGGIGFACSALLIAISGGAVLPLLVALILFNPSSGAFVTLSQATLIDLDPRAEERAMARWVVAGTLGQLAGAGLLGLSVAGGAGWRGAFAIVAAFSVIALAGAWRWPFTAPQGHEWRNGAARAFLVGLREAGRALRQRAVLRWTALLQMADLMGDILRGFLALYMVDVAGATPARAALVLAVWTVTGMLGDVLLLPLLERVAGVRYLRVSAALTSIIFAAFLLLPGRGIQLGLVGLLGLLHSGWYAILMGRLYSSMPGRSATVNTVNNVFGLAGAVIPFGLGALAERIGLDAAMWVLMLGPVALLVGLPRVSTNDTSSRAQTENGSS